MTTLVIAAVQCALTPQVTADVVTEFIFPISWAIYKPGHTCGRVLVQYQTEILFPTSLRRKALSRFELETLSLQD